MIGVGVVGYGYWGPNLARNFAALPECQLRAVCDLVPERLARARKLYPEARMTSDYAEMLRDDEIRAVLVAVPVAHHYPLAKAALLAGKDIFVEKPLTRTVEQAKELLELADKQGCLIAVDHTFLFTGAVQKIKQLVDSQELGDLLYFDSVRINLGLFQPDVNVIYDLAPHDLSILLHLIGQNPKSVRAMGSSLVNREQESLAYLHLEYENGFVAHFHFSWLAPVKIRKTIIAGSRKMLVYDDLEQTEKIKVYDKGVVLQNLDQDSLNKIRVDYRTGDMLAPKLAHREALSAEAEHFIHCVRDRKTPLADGVHGLKVVRVLEATARSLLKGGQKVLIQEG